MKLGGLGLILITLAIAGCGGSSSKNPAKNYSGLQERPISNDKPDTQSIASQALTIDVDDNPNSISVPQYMEGQEGSTKISVRILAKGIDQVNLQAEGLPAGASLTSIGNNTWMLRWTPPSNFVSQGQSAAVKNVKFIARVAHASDDRLYKMGTVQTLPIVVTKNMATPKVLAINGISSDCKTVVEEGKSIPISIDIIDPTNSPSAPNLSFTSALPNAESFVGDLNNYRGVDPNKPASQSLGGGKWRFNLLLDFRAPHIMPVKYNSEGKPDVNADSVQTKFEVAAVSGLGTASVPIPACVTAVYSFRNVEAVFPAEATKFTAQSDNAPLKFNLVVPGDHGIVKVDLDAANKTLAKWDGGAKLDCPQSGQASQSECTLTFAPTCKAQANYTLKFRATSELGNKKRPTDFERKIQVVKPESCVPAKTQQASGETNKKQQQAKKDAKKEQVASSASASKGGAQ